MVFATFCAWFFAPGTNACGFVSASTLGRKMSAGISVSHETCPASSTLGLVSPIRSRTIPSRTHTIWDRSGASSRPLWFSLSRTNLCRISETTSLNFCTASSRFSPLKIPLQSVRLWRIFIPRQSLWLFPLNSFVEFQRPKRTTPLLRN